MHKPCAARHARSTPKLGASPAAIVGRTSSALATTIDRRRPIRSERGPQSHTPAATAATTAEIVRPVPAGPTWKVRPMSGRIAWVEYIVANIPALPSRKPAIAPTLASPPTGSSLTAATLPVGRDAARAIPLPVLASHP